MNKTKHSLIKIILLILFICSFIALFSSIILFYLPPDHNQLNFVQQLFVYRINNTWDHVIKTIPKDKKALITYPTLVNALNPLERNLVLRILSVEPKEPGSMELIVIKPKILKVKGKEITIDQQYYPKEALKDFEAMTSAMKKDLGKRLYIECGYRSPGIQTYLFFHYLPENSFSLNENIKWIILPGHSQHNHPVNTAADLINQEGINGQDRGQKGEDFEKLPEYKWLRKNAVRYNFYLPYPRKNAKGMAFEPWHWRWKRTRDVRSAR